jgi:SOS-response transcriptional repressor LexA
MLSHYPGAIHLPPRTKPALGKLALYRLALPDRPSQGWVADKVSELAGDDVSQQAVGYWETGKVNLQNVHPRRLRAYASVLKISLEQLAEAVNLSARDLFSETAIQNEPFLNGSEVSLPPSYPSTVHEIPEVVLMPVYSLASAGIPMQDAEPLDYDPIAMPRDQWHPALMLFLAEGDSMSDGQEDSIRSGDILHVDMRDTDPTEGRVMVVQIPGQGVTVKRVRMLGGAYWLFSDNPDQRKYPPFQADEAKILGGVHELTRKVKVRLS